MTVQFLHNKDQVNISSHLGKTPNKKRSSGGILYYIYLDQSAVGGRAEYCGYGCLVTDYKIGASVIDNALKRLREDHDVGVGSFAKQDQETLAVGHFHAAHDSRNAHSYLCDAINGRIVGRFRHVLSVKKKAFEDFGGAYSLGSELSVVDVFGESLEATLIFRQQSGLTKGSIRTWWFSLWKDLLRRSSEFPFKTLFYPRLNIVMVGKNEPGLQILDFLLWSSNRKTLGIKCPWLDRIKVSLAFQTQPCDDNSYGGQSLYIGFPFLARTKISYYDIDNYRENDPILNSDEILWRYFVHAQRTINIVYKNGVTPTIDHFWREIEYLYKNKLRDRDPGFIEKLAICFLKLFDNYPVINRETPLDDKAFWLSCRKKLAFLLDAHNILSMLTALTFHDIHIYFIDNEPRCLELS